MIRSYENAESTRAADRGDATLLVADPREVYGLLGAEFASQLTYPGIYRGSPLNVSPVIVTRGSEKTVVISEADSDACRVIAGDFSRQIYGRYFSWDKDLSAPVATFAEAVRKVAGDAQIVCDAALPVSRYEMLAGSGPVCVPEQPDATPVYVYSKPRAEIEAQWLATRDADTAQFAPFIRTLPHGDELLEACTVSAKGFAPLDALCAQKGLDALYVTAPHEVEMFCGLPSNVIAQHGITALFLPGAANITLITRIPFARADMVGLGRAAGVAEVLSRGHFARIGILKCHLAIGDYLPLQHAGLALEDADYLLKRWQDRRAGDDLVYFILAGNAVLHGIKAAKEFFLRHREGMVERDLVAVYHQAVRRFAAQYGFETRVSAYFDIVHSGGRTFLPATAADYPVSASDPTIKFDMGLMAADAFGCNRGCSDIARTICRDPAIEALHDRLRAILVEELIPAIRPGMNGAEIHAIGVDKLRPLEDQMRALKLLPAGKGIDGYLRDCGHTIQRQTISSVYFLPGVTERVELGMLGCTEYVWPIGDVLIAVEDGYVVTDAATIPFTADVAS